MFKIFVLGFLAVTLPECTIASNACVGKPDGTLLPDPDNCNKFFNCNGGVAFIGICPENLYFNPENLRCDYEWNVDCSNLQNPEETVECPPEGITFVASKLRCDWYYICMSGKPTLRECADGMHFSEKDLRCEPEETANCQITTINPSSSTSPSTSSSTASSTSSSTSSSTASSTSSTSSSTQITTTPSPSNEFDKYCKPDTLHTIPHPYDCSLFIFCFNGTAITRNCGEELHYSATAGSCVLPREAQCIFDGTICPANNDPNDIVVIENIYDCTSFYMCFNGSPVPIQCAPGQHWNQTNKTCVLEKYSKCEALEYPFPDLNLRDATCNTKGSYLIPQPTEETIFLLCIDGTPTVLDYSPHDN